MGVNTGALVSITVVKLLPIAYAAVAQRLRMKCTHQDDPQSRCLL